MRKSSESFAGLPWQADGFLRRQNRSLSINKNKYRGMTLLELLIVLSLLSIVALASTSLIIDNGDLKRQLETESRWEAIRKAIIGEPNLILNGSPYVSGYMADMGRLPNNIQALFIQGTQPDWTSIDLYEADTGFSSALGGGWRGPYLYTAGSREYRDGWNNHDFLERNDVDDPIDAIDDDATNFGWLFMPTGVPPNHTDIVIQSLGDINVLGDTAVVPKGSTDFLQDFPTDNTLNIVNENEWRLSSNPITFNINFNRPVGEVQADLELRIYRYIDNNDDTADNTDIDETIADATFAVAVGDTATATQTVTPDDLPIGRYAAVIWCTHNTPLDIDDDTVYDGNCDTTNAHNPYYFTLLPSVSQVTVRWNLP